MSKNLNNLRPLALRCVAVFATGILAVGSRAVAEVPQQINHQGVVSVDSERFDGTGAFRFAIVDPDTGINLWTNDGSKLDPPDNLGGVPDDAVSLPVADGVYSIGLGDTGLANMTPIPSSVFNDDNAVLRIWFDDGVNGNQQLTPDHKLTTAPYSFRLPNIFAEGSNVGIGTTMPEAKLDVDGEIKGFGIVSHWVHHRLAQVVRKHPWIAQRLAGVQRSDGQRHREPVRRTSAPRPEQRAQVP